MAYKQVVGAFPITFVSETVPATVGTQRQIPLSLITYDPTASPAVKIANWSGADAALAAGIVLGLIQQQILSVPD
jgi:hypothetical protein